jgi:hypothetical protein
LNGTPSTFASYRRNRESDRVADMADLCGDGLFARPPAGWAHRRSISYPEHITL